MGEAREKAMLARKAARAVSGLGSDQRNAALRAMAPGLRKAQGAILAANGEDVACAREAATAEQLIDRLSLTPERLESMAAGLEGWRPSPTPWAASWRGRACPTACRSRSSRFPWAWWPWFTRPGPT